MRLAMTTSKQTSTQANKKASGKEREDRERAKKKGNIFENRFRSGGEDNERRMAKHVMQEMKVYDGYLVCLDLT